MIIGILIGFIGIAVVLLCSSKNPFRQAHSFSDTALMVDQTIPDSAIGFGYKCMWFAVKTDNKKKLAELFKLTNVSDCNWKVGIDKAYRGAVFITPVIDGWTLTCGWGLPHGDTKEGIEEVKNILKILSKELGEAQFFCTHRVTEYHCWMKAKNGQIERVYSFSGESGENIVVEGKPTKLEQTLMLANTFSDEAKDDKYFEREDVTWANEEVLMRVAEQWSIDPTKLENRRNLAPGIGLSGQWKEGIFYSIDR